MSIVGKVMETMVFKELYNFLEATNRLLLLQSAYQPRHSTTTQLIKSYEFIQQAMDDGKKCMFMFCNTSKAFDCILHKGLLHKLKMTGVGACSSGQKTITVAEG